MSRRRKANYTYDEMKGMFGLDTKEGKHHKSVFMPNEIFHDLRVGMHDEKMNKISNFKSSTHVAYAYAYVYLSHYMYRYCKYYVREDYYNMKDIDEKMIKKILGFNEKTDQYTYLTKSNGVLDQIGYIKKVSDKPYDYTLDKLADVDGKDVFQPYFKMESNVVNFGESKPRKNRKINLPVKGFWREDWAKEENYVNGTFYEQDNTHEISFDIFMHCMSDPELGVEGFYLYSYLTYMTDKFPNGYDSTIDNFSHRTSMAYDEVMSQLRKLEERNMISCDHKPFCVNKPKSKKTKSNTYYVNNFKVFVDEPSEYKKIPKQLKVPKKWYEKNIGFVEDD